MKVLLCSYYKYPAGDAGSIRHEKFAQMFQKLGHEVLVVGTGKDNGFKTECENNVCYTSLRYGESDFLDKVKTRLKYWGNLRRMLREFQPDCIVLDHMSKYVTKRLKKYGKKNQTLLIHDSVEWFSPQQFKHGSFSRAYQHNDQYNRRIIDQSFRVIAISQFLQEHFSSRGISCVRIPIVVSDEDIVLNKTLDEKIRLLYAGQPGKKDYLHLMIDAVSMLDDETRQKIEFVIVGCTFEQLVDSGIAKEKLLKIQDCIQIKGRVSHDEVLECLNHTDFTLLMRSSDMRYAKAGFPTKVVESLSKGTPVICNLTSDLHLYLQDRKNALLVEDCSAVSLKAKIEEAVSLSCDQRQQMYQQALDTARECFILDNYLEQLQEILK